MERRARMSLRPLVCEDVMAGGPLVGLFVGGRPLVGPFDGAFEGPPKGPPAIMSSHTNGRNDFLKTNFNFWGFKQCFKSS